MTLNIRPATVEDAPALCDVNLRSIREICGKDYPPDRLDTWCANKVPGNYLKWLADPKLRLYAGERDGRVAGVGLLDVNGWIFLLYVEPEALGSGLGKALLAHMEQEARAMGLGRLQLKSTITARDFYARQGYEDLGPTGDEIPSFRMEKAL
ncbi:MAG: family N-acetyltransferase [Cyanobacteria bacterium RYN_339]|nr:family N-acetyltransferase [Cyanobacteria bacterium RYN_339]